MKYMNLIKTKTAAVVAFVTAMALPAMSHAALTSDVKTAIQGGFTDAQEGMGLMVVGFAALFAVGLVIRLVRK